MKRSSKIAFHIVFWFIIFAMYYSFLIYRGSSISFDHYLNLTIKTILEFGIFYIAYLIIIPKFFNRNKYRRLLAASLIAVIMYIPLYAAVLTEVDILIGIKEDWSAYSFQVVIATYYVILFAFLGGSFRLAFNGLEVLQQKTLLEKQNVKNELAILRSQVNPHFLFNTLNTIHSYIISNNPNSSKAVIKLSDIMRYMLYDASKESITLNNEIAYLNSYIDLQKFRLENENLIEFNISGDPEGIIIPPMLLIPFVENAFKHGKRKDLSPSILIDLNITNDYIEFSVKNYHDHGVTVETGNSRQVGLQNVKRRLDLMFAEKHLLEIKEEEIFFSIYLKINHK